MHLSYAVGDSELKEELGSWGVLGHSRARWRAWWVDILSEAISRYM